MELLGTGIVLPSNCTDGQRSRRSAELPTICWRQIVGYGREDLVSGRVHWTELSPPEWRERDVLTQAELNSTGIVQPFEKEYFRRDGSRVPVLVGAALFKEGGDRLAFVLDLTERKRTEDRLRRSEAWLSQSESLSRSGTRVYNATTNLYIYWSDESYR